MGLHSLSRFRCRVEQTDCIVGLAVYFVNENGGSENCRGHEMFFCVA